jgi:hypothetical protein
MNHASISQWDPARRHSVGPERHSGLLTRRPAKQSMNLTIPHLPPSVLLALALAIGIRIAVGAQPADILLQFLIEAITLSLLGGAIGVLFGVSASDLVGRLTSFVPIVSTGTILLAFGVSCAVGIFFGFYPARKATLLNPIDALRYE